MRKLVLIAALAFASAAHAAEPLQPQECRTLADAAYSARAGLESMYRSVSELSTVPLQERLTMDQLVVARQLDTLKEPFLSAVQNYTAALQRFEGEMTDCER